MHHSEPVETLLARAEALIRLNRLREAEKMLYQALAVEPQHQRCLWLLGRCKLLAQKCKEAMEVVRQLWKFYPDDDYAFFLAAEVCLKEQHPAEAFKHIQKAIALQPEEASYFAVLSRCHLLLQDEPAAVQAAVDGLEIDPENVNLLSALGIAKFRLGVYEEALEVFHQALSIAPNNPALLNNIGLVLGYNQQNSEARKMFADALKRAPDLNTAALNFAGSKAKDNIFYRLHYRLFGPFLRSHGRYMFMLLFLFFGFICLAEIVRPDWTIVAKLLDLFSWLTLFASIAVFVMPQIGNILVVFRRQYKHLYSLNDKVASATMFLLYFASFVSMLYGLFSGGESSRIAHYLSLALLSVMLLLTIRFGTLRDWRPLATILFIFSYMAGGLLLLYMRAMNIGFFYLFYVSSGFLVLGFVMYLLRPRNVPNS